MVSNELKNIIQYVSRNKNIKLIGITSKKTQLFIKILIVLLVPYSKEAGPENIVPTSSTTTQLALGDAIAISCMYYKKFTKFDFKKFHPGGTLSIKLKTVGDLMKKGKKIPVVRENIKMKKALKIISDKKLGVLIVNKKNGFTSGIVTDGDLKRIAQKCSVDDLEIKKVMKKNPMSIIEDTLAAQHYLESKKNYFSLCS